MPKITSSFLAFAVLFISCDTNIGQSTDAIKQSQLIANKSGVDGTLQTNSIVFAKHLVSIKNYAGHHNCSNQCAFLVDMAIHSGTKRFFVVELKTGKVLVSGLVSHGCSRTQLKNGERSYSNENSSLCTSLGKYKIGEKYYGKFGLAYKLTGLDATNNHAYERAVVLHSYPYVPDTEKASAICQSWGCPMVSPKFLSVLAGYIDVSSKPILLDIFDSGK